MNIKQIERILTNSGIEKNEAKIEAKMLIKHFLMLSDIDLAMGDEFETSKDLQEKLLEAANLRANTKRPIQHIIGLAHFMGEEFIVNENVLIPRDETEILVRKAVEIINANNFKSGLDIGTGSGCIACMTAKLTDIQIIGVDISTAALQVALDNTTKLNLYNKAIFRKSDIFSNIKEGEKFDIIISNPPYVPLSEKENLQKEVTFDPQSALFTEDELGIEFYEKIAKEAPKYLNKGGYLLFELGINQAQAVREFLDQSGFSNIETQKDLAGIERIIFAQI